MISVTGSLRERLLAHVQAENRPLRKSDIVPHFADSTPESVGRELRFLWHRGLIEKLNGRSGPYVPRDYVAPPPSLVTTAPLESTTYAVAGGEHGASPAGRVSGGRGRVVMPNEFVRRLTGGTVPQDAFWTFAAGPSGEPFIRDGQPVFVERTTDLVDGALYAVWLGETDSDVIKRIEVTGPNAVVLRSDNPAVRTRTFTRTEDPEVWTDDAGASVRLLIQGRVRWPDDTARAASLLATEAMALFAKTLRYQGD